MHLIRRFVPLALVACAPAPTPTGSNVVVPTRDSVVPPQSSPLTVAAVTAPEGVVVDGDLGEWKTEARVAVALTAKGAYVAAQLDDGFWLGIRGEPAQVPPVGEYRLVGGSEVDPEMGLVIPACLAQKPDDAVCLAAKKKIEDGARAYERRFTRWYRIDRDRVRVADDAGALGAVEEAKLVVKSGFEISLPLSALPRFAVAPIRAIGLGVRSASPAPPELDETEWTVATLNTPVAFEPLAELRALAFGESGWMSYQPGAPLEIEATRYPSQKDRSRFVVAKEPLYTKQLLVGDVEVGYLAAGHPAEVVDRYGVSDRIQLAVLPKNGSAAALPIKGTPLLLAERAGAVHAVFLATADEMAHDGSPNSVFVPVTAATLSGFVIGSDGKHREISFDDIPNPYWEDVEPFQGKDTLGLRGHTSEWRRGVGKQGDLVELTWRWDAKKGAYVGKRTRGKSPPP